MPKSNQVKIPQINFPPKELIKPNPIKKLIKKVSNWGIKSLQNN